MQNIPIYKFINLLYNRIINTKLYSTNYKETNKWQDLQKMKQNC